MTIEASAPQRWRVHRVICELDVRGEIDAHAAMCLHHAIGAASAQAIEMILVDLRDLTAIGPVGLALFTAHDANCRAHGIELGLLISGDECHDRVAEAFVLAGLADALQYACEPSAPAPPRPARQLYGEQSVRRRGLARAARSVTSRRRRRASTA